MSQYKKFGMQGPRRSLVSPSDYKDVEVSLSAHDQAVLQDAINVIREQVAVTGHGAAKAFVDSALREIEQRLFQEPEPSPIKLPESVQNVVDAIAAAVAAGEL